MSLADDLNNAVQQQIAERGVNGGVPVIADPRDQKLPQNDGRAAAPAQGNQRLGTVSMEPARMTGTAFPQQGISTQHLRPLPKYQQPGTGGQNIQPDEKR